MTYDLDEAGYLQTREKFAAMEKRSRALENRTDLPATHSLEVRRSYLDMMQQYAREIKLYEAKHPPREDAASPSS